MFFNRKHHLTKLCERVSPRMLENAAMDDASFLRKKFNEGVKRGGASDSDRAWSAWMRDSKHPKRTTIVYMIVSLAAADFWKEVNKITSNPFRSTDSDVIVAEALIFFWYNFYLFVRHAVRKFVRHAVRKKELIEADIQAVSAAGTTIGHVIQETTQWPVTEILSTRLDEYEYRATTENPIEVFSRVLLRSIGKKAIDDPDRCLNPLNGLDDMPIIMRAMIHVTAMLPAYWEIYKNIVQNYPMD